MKMSLENIYSKGVKKTLTNYWCAWWPNVQFELGMLGF